MLASMLLARANSQLGDREPSTQVWNSKPQIARCSNPPPCRPQHPCTDRHERDRTHKKSHRARIAEAVTDLKGEKAVFYPLGAI